MDFKTKSKNARAFIVLLAAFIALLLNMKYERELIKSLFIVLIVIIIFYGISTIAIRLIEKIVNMESIEVIEFHDEEESDMEAEESDSEKLEDNA